VKRPWDAEVKIGLKPPEPLPENTSIVEVFDRSAIAGKLLILGEPGSGKTTTMLELAKELVTRAENDPSYPIPVLFNLSSWKSDHQSIIEWLVDELKSKYGVPKKLGQECLTNRQILLLLDGLDEVKSTFQEFTIRAINQLLEGEYRPQYLVVCSRSEEYHNYETMVNLSGAIYLQSLTHKQIFNYLTLLNYTVLWQNISSDINLLELAKIPLLLNIMIVAYQEISINRWQQMTSTINCHQHMLEAYVQRMLEWGTKSKVYVKQKPPNNKKIRIWLIWLAQHLQRESQTEFWLESIHPACLKSNFQKRIYRFGIILNSWLIWGLTGLILGTITLGINAGLVIGIFSATISSWMLVSFSASSVVWRRAIPQHDISQKDIFAEVLSKTIGSDFHVDDPVTPIGDFQWSWRNLLGALLVSLFRGILVGICLVSIFQVQIIFGCIFALIVILTHLLKAGLGLFEKPNVKTRVTFAQGIWQSLLSAGLIGLLWIAFGIAFWISGLWKTTLPSNLFLVIGTLLILGNWQASGGLFCIQHFTLRLILYFNGYTPWNYARFLDYCTERMLLQRVGGRYRFIHKLLQDHFAQMPLERLDR
jgi:DNA polymerase III delta prime subunit